MFGSRVSWLSWFPAYTECNPYIISYIPQMNKLPVQEVHVAIAVASFPVASINLMMRSRQHLLHFRLHRTSLLTQTRWTASFFSPLPSIEAIYLLQYQSPCTIQSQSVYLVQYDLKVFTLYNMISKCLPCTIQS